MMPLPPLTSLKSLTPLMPATLATVPRFSVIMNVYNGERWLRDALDSVVAQTCGDWELIFWDDQSRDGSAAVLQPYLADPRVRYFHAPVQTPLGEARQQAIEQARGSWLAFLDQDDFWTPDKLAEQARVIDAWRGPPLAIVYGRAMKFGVLQKLVDFDRWHEFQPLPQGDIFEALFADSCFICQSAVCLATAAVREIGPIPGEHRFCPDYYFYTALSTRHAAACTQQVVCWYRIHSAAMSREHYLSVMQEMLSILERWRSRLPAAVYLRRRRIQHSLIGLRHITAGSDPAGGLLRIWRHGSLRYLLERPFVQIWRRLRRAWHRMKHGKPRLPAALAGTQSHHP